MEEGKLKNIEENFKNSRDEFSVTSISMDLEARLEIIGGEI